MENETHEGYFRRGGLDLSFIGAVVIALLVTAGTRVRVGLEGSWAACAWMDTGTGAGAGVGAGFAVADALGAGAVAGCTVLLLSRLRDKAFASRLLVVLVGRGC
jgi:hypothetical protein